MKKTLLAFIVCLLVFAVTIISVTSHIVKDSNLPTAVVEEELLACAEIENQRDILEVISEMNSIDNSREIENKESNSVAESISESVEASVAQSIAESIAEFASASEAESIRESVEASIAESKAIAASQAESIRQEQEKNPTVATYRKLFSKAVVIGDSRAKGSVDCGLLTENEVVYYGGASVGSLFETTKRAALLMRPKALFIVGLNDLGYYKRDAERFKQELKRLINTYLEINPNCKIYLQDILPVLEFGRPDWPNMDARPAFVQAIKEVCAECGYTFVSANDYAYPEYVNSEDGAHYNRTFYFLWAKTISEQMGLWED